MDAKKSKTSKEKSDSNGDLCLPFNFLYYLQHDVMLLRFIKFQKAFISISITRFLKLNLCLPPSKRHFSWLLFHNNSFLFLLTTIAALTVLGFCSKLGFHIYSVFIPLFTSADFQPFLTKWLVLSLFAHAYCSSEACLICLFFRYRHKEGASCWIQEWESFSGCQWKDWNWRHWNGIEPNPFRDQLNSENGMQLRYIYREFW